MGYVFIRGLDLPSKVEGVTVLDANGDYNVYINIKLSEDHRRLTINHELAHIEKDHFYDDELVIINELEAENNK